MSENTKYLKAIAASLSLLNFFVFLHLVGCGK